MKPLKSFVFVFAAAGLFTACKKKELPEPEKGNAPQFYFTGRVNGTDYNLQAGVGDYYMYSGFKQNTSTNVYGFTATLKQSNCTTCNNSIEFEINDHRASSYNGPSGIDTAFQSLYYPYCSGNWLPVSYKLQFYPLFNNTPQTYLWDFGDGSTSTEQNPTKIYDKAGKYNVVLTTGDPTHKCPRRSCSSRRRTAFARRSRPRCGSWATARP